MKQALRIGMVLVLLVTVTGCAFGPMVRRPDGMLEAHELEKLITGNTVEEIDAETGRATFFYYGKYGKLKRLYYGKTDEGEWRITRKSRLCISIGEIEKQCRVIVANGDTYEKYRMRKNNQHELVSTFRSIEPGDTKGNQ